MKKYQVVGIGNAMVDVLAHASDAFLAAAGMLFFSAVLYGFLLRSDERPSNQAAV